MAMWARRSEGASERPRPASCWERRDSTEDDEEGTATTPPPSWEETGIWRGGAGGGESAPTRALPGGGRREDGDAEGDESWIDADDAAEEGGEGTGAGVDMVGGLGSEGGSLKIEGKLRV